MDLDPQMVQLGVQLAEATVKNTATGIRDRIRSARARQKDQETINELEAIINDLIQDKNELVRIAEEYRQSFVSQEISESDLEYITTHLIPAISRVSEQMAETRGMSSEEVVAVVETLKPLLSKEVIKIVQLVGFNFKRAVGEPLTMLASRAILAQTDAEGTRAERELQTLAVRRELALIELATDPEAYARLMRLYGRPQPEDDSR
jgi:hypothetical protein